MTKTNLTYPIEDFFDSYINGNLSWCRDEFWGSNKTDMREIMHEANFRFDQLEMNRFISVIFLP